MRRDTPARNFMRYANRNRVRTVRILDEAIRDEGVPIALILICGADFPSVVSYERLRFLVAVALLNTVCAFRSRSTDRIIPPEISPSKGKRNLARDFPIGIGMKYPLRFQEHYSQVNCLSPIFLSQF